MESGRNSGRDTELQESGLFDATSDGSEKDGDGTAIEQRFDGFADLAKEGTQVAGRVRLTLNKLTENAREGSIATAKGQLNRLSETVAELSSVVGRLAAAEDAIGLRDRDLSASDYMRELAAELAKKGVTATKGPEPYWLAYPAWVMIERDAKGMLGVNLNGDKLDSIRPSVAASKIAEVVSEKFQTKQFAQLLINVRQLLRRAGAPGQTFTLDDVYDLLAMEPGRSVSRKREFSKAAFFYSIHRLAEEMDLSPQPAMIFPAANRSDIIFFTKDGESRKYLTVKFTGIGAS